MNKRGRLDFQGIRERKRLKWTLLRIEYVVALMRNVVTFEVP